MSSDTAVDPSGIQTGIPAPEMLLWAWASRVGAAPNCERLAERNFVFRVPGLQQTYILKQAGKIDPQGNTPRKITADIDVLRYLQAQGVPVAVPEPTDDHQPYLQHDDRYYTLTPEVPSAPDESAPLDIVYRNTGAAIARLHQALASYTGPVFSWKMDLPPRILEESAVVILRHLEAGEVEKFNRVLEAIRGPVSERLTGLPSQYVHGDCHGGNILRVGAEVSGFIDLDHLPFGPRIWDLCYLLANDAIRQYQDAAAARSWAEDWFTTIIPNLLRGYAHAIPLNEAEKDAAPYLMLGILLIMVAWFFEPLNIPEWANGDLQVFYWIYENLERVQASIQSSVA